MKQRKMWGWIFLSPTLALFLVFFAIPLGYTFYLSFFDANLFQSSFVGLGNYLSLVKSLLFRQVVWNTTKYFLFIIPVSIFLPLILALLITEVPRFGSLFRAIFYLPVAIGGLVIASIWKWIFNPTYGLLNWMLSLVGIGRISWLGDSNFSLISISIVFVVACALSNFTLIYCAAITSLSKELIEAAKLDGAGTFQLVKSIVIPLLRPAVHYITLTSILTTFNIWAFPKLLTEGGPLHSSASFGYWIYETGFIYQRYGLASAQAVMMLFLTVGFGMVLLRSQYDIT